MPTRIICAAINKVDWFALGDGSVSLERPYLFHCLNIIIFNNSFIPSKLYYNNGFSNATNLIITCGMAQAKLT